MKITIAVVLVLALGYFGYYYVANQEPPATTSETVIPNLPSGDNNDQATTPAVLDVANITPISHASFVLEWGDTVMYNDPVGGPEAFAGQPAPDVVFLTDVHGDHLSGETLSSVVMANTQIIAPQAVVADDAFPAELVSQTTVLANGETLELAGFTIEAMPMYNLPDQGIEIRHEQGRGNGYLVSRDDQRLYIAGDTADIPEMRALTDIDIALIPMNLPYTMGVDRAADAVLAFAPTQVVPYHYRTPDGLSDVAAFANLVVSGNPSIEVVQLDWYPETDVVAE